MMFSLQSRRFVALLTAFTTAAFGASPGYSSSSRSRSNSPKGWGSSTTSTSGGNYVPETVPVSEIFFTHGDTNQLDAQYRDGRVTRFVKEVRGKKRVEGEDGFMVRETKRVYAYTDIRPTVYDTAMALLFGADPVKTKNKQMDGILQRLMRRNANFKTVTRGQLSRALADTQRDISVQEGWSCTPEVVVTCESRIEQLRSRSDLKRLFHAHRQGHTDEDLVLGDCQDGETPVYFSQNNRSLHALRMVKSVFQCKMDVTVQQRPDNILTNGHIFDVQRVGLPGMGLRFYLNGGMYYGNWNSDHPAKDQIERTFPGSFQNGGTKYVGYFSRDVFLQCVKDKIADLGLDTSWFDDLTDAQIMKIQMRKLKILATADF